MIIFTPNTVIRSTEINSNLDELKIKTDYLSAPDSGWIEIGSGGSAPAFQNSWVNYGTNYTSCAYRKDAFGYIHLKGLVKTGTMSNAIFTLPAGYRPNKITFASTMSNNLFGMLEINAVGACIPQVGSNIYFCLDNITFKAEQ